MPSWRRILEMSGLLYAVPRQDAQRAKVISALIPYREKVGLGDPRAPLAPAWKRSVATFVDRQRQTLRGGGQYDPMQRRGLVSLELGSCSCCSS